MLADPADTFSQADGKVDYRLEALNINRREIVPMSQNKFGVAENTGERIVDFVAKQFAQLFRFQERGLSQAGAST